jgi:hypothetical protein
MNLREKTTWVLKHLIFSSGVILLACQQHDDPPDLAEIARGYCAIVQMCDSSYGWESQEMCEAYSADEFEKTKTEDRECFDARIIMETCIGAFASCEEYTKFSGPKSYDCQIEFSDFYLACRLP